MAKTSAKNISQKLTQRISSDARLRAQIISIGIPILMPDGKTLLRSNEIKIPAFRGENELPVTAKSINLWATNGWVDLRVSNLEKWKSRFKELMATIEKQSKNETSSRFFRNREYLSNFNDIDPGKIVGWIFTVEEKGKRMKS